MPRLPLKLTVLIALKDVHLAHGCSRDEMNRGGVVGLAPDVGVARHQLGAGASRHQLEQMLDGDWPVPLVTGANETQVGRVEPPRLAVDL